MAAAGEQMAPSADSATVGDERMRRLVEALAERNAQLEHALESRIVIEQAKGVLAERWGVRPDQAFEALRSAARMNRIRIHDLAVRVVASPSTPSELAHEAPR
jgi:AmiR/NasT family two-component response regulator